MNGVTRHTADGARGIFAPLVMLATILGLEGLLDGDTVPIFISHSHEDQPAYSSLCLALDGAGVVRWDPVAMPLGASLAEQLRLAIQQCEVCVFLATSRSLRSRWCLAELGAFWGAGKPVIVYLADPTVKESALPPQLQGNLWTNDAQRLLTAIKRETSRPAAPGKNIAQPMYFESSGDFGIDSDWVRLLEDTSARFDVLGISLGGWRRARDFSRLVTQKCSTGTEARILLTNEANPVLKEVVHPIDPAESYESLLAEIKQSRIFYERLARDAQKLQFRQISRGYPHFFLTLTDASAVLIQYFYSMTWGHGPLWLAPSGSTLYELTLREFEMLWNLNAP